jgi:hypothetical protein
MSGAITEPPQTNNPIEASLPGSSIKGAEEPYQYSIENDTLTTPGQKRFYASEQCEEARKALEQMVHSSSYNTDSTYFQGNALDFVERHLHYLSTHPAANLAGYLSNLKLMTNIKRSQVPPR